MPFRPLNLFTKSKVRQAIFKKTKLKPKSIQLGRVFRKLGLPPWTLTGIGISAIWFNYLGGLFEKLLRDILNLHSTPVHWSDYIPPIIVLLVPFGIVIILSLVLKNSKISNPSVLWGTALQKPKGKRGLILLVSNVDSALFSIKYHLLHHNTLETVWLLPSDDTSNNTFGNSTKSLTDKILGQAEALAKSIERPIKIEIHPHGVSPADSQDTFDAVNRIFRFSNYDTQEIIADFTGGTKPMSVGMIMACLKTDRELEYVAFNPSAPSGQKMSGPYLVDYQYSAFDLIG
jgi:hypothetical protein